MEIITIPHPGLRKKSKPVSTLSKEIKNFVSELETTLTSTRQPRGVGLSAPQVDQPWRIFFTLVKKPQLFINPRITKKSGGQILGETPEDEKVRYEGCLSMPKLYSPVPRWQEIELEFSQIENDELVEKKDIFDNFHARVIQHELDHLDGVLFTDHALENSLPVYQENSKTGQIEQVEPSFLELF